MRLRSTRGHEAEAPLGSPAVCRSPLGSRFTHSDGPQRSRAAVRSSQLPADIRACTCTTTSNAQTGHGMLLRTPGRGSLPGVLRRQSFLLDEPAVSDSLRTPNRGDAIVEQCATGSFRSRSALRLKLEGHHDSRTGYGLLEGSAFRRSPHSCGFSRQRVENCAGIAVSDCRPSPYTRVPQRAR